MQCGLLGGKLGHSYSPQIHRLLGDYPYSLLEKSPDELEEFLKHGSFTGLNVTIPYKKTVIPFCDELSQQAEKLGAVNTIVRRRDGTLIGHNTDFFGFASMVQKSGLQVKGKKALVLGSGGASATAVAVLQELGATVVVISRRGANTYETIADHADAAVVVNATPVGMYPNVDASPVDLSVLPNLQGVLDLIYNPARTKLLIDARARGLVGMNGLWMLVAQAKESAQWFTGEDIDDAVIEKIYRKLRRQMENTVLIGMPGCGKTTVGQLVAKNMGKTFVDADQVLEAQAGMTIPEIFATEGEVGFRRRETEVLCELGKQSGLVIATGGGCVTQAENYPLLHQNGTLFWLQRPLDCLATEGRPLSQKGTLQEMYEKRQPLYHRFADHVIGNNTSPEDAAAAICQWEEAL